MNSPKLTLGRHPKLRAILRPIYYWLKREPMTVNATLAGSGLKECLGTETPTILEIGSNFGDTTVWFLETFASPRIFCFEPDPRAIIRFRSNVGDDPECGSSNRRWEFKMEEQISS